MKVVLEKKMLQEINEKDLREINGGWLGPAILFQLCMEVLEGSFISDIKRGYNETSGR